MNLQQIFSSYKTNITIDIPPRVIICFLVTLLLLKN